MLWLQPTEHDGDKQTASQGPGGREGGAGCQCRLLWGEGHFLRGQERPEPIRREMPGREQAASGSWAHRAVIIVTRVGWE